MTESQVDELLSTLGNIDDSLGTIANILASLAMPPARLEAEDKQHGVPCVVEALRSIARGVGHP